MIAVRPVRPDEWRRWRELRLRALADTPDAFGELLASAEARPDAEWAGWVATRRDRVAFWAERDGVPIGMIVLQVAGDTRHADIYAMWVAPEARRAGAGRALVEAALASARTCGALDVTLRVTQPQAKQFYVAMGFADSGTRVPLRPDSAITSAVMTKRLPPLVMGVVNVTPDSFSDGGVYLEADAAVAHGLELMAAGADILDVGGEATNPRATPVTAEVELRRVIGVVERLAAAGARVSIDTTKAVVAREAVKAGASIINDVSGGLFDAEMRDVLGTLEVTYIAGHLRGKTLAEVFAAERGVPWQAVASELADRLADLPPAAAMNAWVDPGIGFGKGADPEGNLELLRHAGDISSVVGRPIVVGPSRKRFLRRLMQEIAGDVDPAALDAASVTASIAAVRAGAHIVRAHNVALLRTALTVYTKV